MAIKINGTQGTTKAAQKNSVSKNSSKFDSVLNEKSASSSKQTNLKADSELQARNKRQVSRDRYRLAELVDKNAKTEEIVKEALKNNPLFQQLSPEMKQDLLSKVSETINPMMGKFS